MGTCRLLVQISSSLFSRVFRYHTYYSLSQFGVCQLYVSYQFRSLIHCSAGPSGKYSSLSKSGICKLHVSCQFRSSLLFSKAFRYVGIILHPNMESVGCMSAASSDIFFAVQQSLQVNTVLYPKLASVSYMSTASPDLFFAVQQGLQVNTVLYPKMESVSYGYMSAVSSDLFFAFQQVL
jgi:hypothetical protein